MSNSPREVVVQLTGGLGNQLFQLAAGLQVAKTKPLFMEQDLGAPRRNQFGAPDVSSFKLPDQVTIEKRRKPSAITTKILNFVLRRSAQQTSRISPLLRCIASFMVSIYRKSFVHLVGARGLGYCDLNSSYSKPYLLGYFQSYRWVQEPDVLQKMMSLCIEDSLEISNYKDLSLSECPLVVHIRLGDYVDHPQFGIPSKYYYKKALEQLWSSGKYRKIWLFSNDAKLALEYLPSNLTNSIRVIPEIEFSAAKTLEVMRMGHGYVIGNSTYSWWAATLSYANTASVIAPHPWFAGMEDPIQLIPKNWQTISAFSEEQ